MIKIFIEFCSSDWNKYDHYLSYSQYYNLGIAWWLNSGVQLLLFLSGYLYSNRTEYTYNKVKQQFIKIVVPYYVLVIPLLAICILLGECTLFDVIRALLLSGVHQYIALSHLWFVPYILMSYVCTPMYMWQVKGLKQKSRRRIFLLIVFYCILLIMFYEIYAAKFISTWMLCYFLGLVVGWLNENDIVLYKMLCVLSVLVCICLISATIIFNNFQFIFSLKSERLVECINQYAHVALGISLFIMLRKLFRVIANNKKSILLDWNEKNSYFIYLIHQVFILGPFSLLVVPGGGYIDSVFM